MVFFLSTTQYYSVFISFRLLTADVKKPIKKPEASAGPSLPPVWRGHLAMSLQELDKFNGLAYSVSGDTGNLQQVLYVYMS